MNHANRLKCQKYIEPVRYKIITQNEKMRLVWKKEDENGKDNQLSHGLTKQRVQKRIQKTNQPILLKSKGGIWCRRRRTRLYSVEKEQNNER